MAFSLNSIKDSKQVVSIVSTNHVFNDVDDKIRSVEWCKFEVSVSDNRLRL